ncbi:protein-L-isoaspartate O-methyltransferase family protein [Enterovirga aerilata]|uniref:Protein-L-isoaspartate O-methyltransferase n=1 Tax=Enterovirga aerilata TaxID=2730920 RepID=A0A849I6C5_9HYPH|nr:SAM-dependent methyltransferase [Enterovirga sp. DB1703]NNM71875.1 SAM-dependent methyltransferase [Enterovirga sp. DB1703]
MSEGRDLAAIRARYAADAMAWARRDGLENSRVEAAFAAVPRESYLTPPPWRIFSPGGGILDEETSDPARLYQDVLVVLDRAKGINNGQPSLHAAWMAEVDPRPGETVIQIGIGAGYYTAILAELVGEGGRIKAYEIETRLAELARRNLSSLPQVRVHAVSAVGAELPQADVVYVSAGAAAPDPAWLRCLEPGGRLVMPWQPSPFEGRTLLVRRQPGGLAVRTHGSVAFVGCIGAEARDVRARGKPAQPLVETRSVWLAAEHPPDDTATALYGEVWFSSRDV